jgi:hypothetical protein
LFIDGAPQAIGTYGAIGSGADFEMSLFTGSGLLRVTSLGLPGDFNRDGVVNAADYVVWRKTDGMQSGHDMWRANFGATAGRGSDMITSAPEPASLWLVIFATAAGNGRRSRPNRRSP